MGGLFGNAEKTKCCCGGGNCCACDATYAGCMESNPPVDECLDDTKAGQIWFSGTPPVTLSSNDWGDIDCRWYWDETFGKSMMGCDDANVRTTFVIMQIRNPSAWAIELGVEACDWICEVYADGVYQTYVLEFAKECIFQSEEEDDTLDLIQFYHVPIPGISSTVTITMVRLESLTDLCVPSGRPGV